MKVDKALLRWAVERIPCELSVMTFDPKRNGSAWLGCNECARCLLLKALSDPSPEGFITKQILPKPVNGGYELREDLRAQAGRAAEKPAGKKH